MTLNEARAAGVTLWGEGSTLRYKGPRKAIEELLPTLKTHKPELLAALQTENLDALLARACQGVDALDAAAFKSLLSPEDIEDISGGHIPVHTLNAFARSLAAGIRVGRITVVLAAAIPKPAVCARVRCTDCRHFDRDTIGDGSGIGRCKIGGEGDRTKIPLWANAERDCKDFTARAAS